MTKAARAYETRIHPYLTDIKTWRSQGATFQEIAKRLGTTSSYLSAKCKTHPQLAEALKSIPLSDEERFHRAVTAERYRKRSLSATKLFIRKQASVKEKWDMVCIILEEMTKDERTAFQNQVANWREVEGEPFSEG